MAHNTEIPTYYINIVLHRSKKIFYNLVNGSGGTYDGLLKVYDLWKKACFDNMFEMTDEKYKMWSDINEEINKRIINIQHHYYANYYNTTIEERLFNDCVAYSKLDEQKYKEIYKVILEDHVKSGTPEQIQEKTNRLISLEYAWFNYHIIH